LNIHYPIPASKNEYVHVATKKETESLNIFGMNGLINHPANVINIGIVNDAILLILITELNIYGMFGNINPQHLVLMCVFVVVALMVKKKKTQKHPIIIGGNPKKSVVTLP
jgi:hypothetical protein